MCQGGSRLTGGQLQECDQHGILWRLLLNNSCLHCALTRLCLHYPAGPIPVVLIHGMGACHEHWNKLLAELDTNR